jgi:hypothetical protein
MGFYQIGVQCVFCIRVDFRLCRPIGIGSMMGVYKMALFASAKWSPETARCMLRLALAISHQCPLGPRIHHHVIKDYINQSQMHELGQSDVCLANDHFPCGLSARLRLANNSIERG